MAALYDPNMLTKRARQLATSYRVNTFGVMFFLTLGVVVILNIAGVLPWGIWIMLWRFWPVFLVMLLLQKFFGKYPVINKVIAAIGFGIILTLVLYSGAKVSSRLNIQLQRFYTKIAIIIVGLPNYTGDILHEQISVEDDFEEVISRDLNFSIPAGKITLTDADQGEHLSVKASYYEKFGKPTVKKSFTENVLRIDLSAEQKIGPLISGVEEVNYEISIGQPDLPTNLNIEVGAGLLRSDLTKLNVETLSVKVGAGAVEITIDENSMPKEEINIGVGTGTARLKLPFRQYVRINHKISVGRLRVNHLNFYADGTHTTTNYRITKDPLEINVKVGAGEVFVDTTGN